MATSDMLVKCLKCNTRAVNMCDDYRSTELCIFIFSKYLRMTDKLLKHVCCSYNVYVAACGRWLRGFWVPEGAGMLHFMRWGSFGVACGGQGGGLFSTNLRRIALKGKWFWREKKNRNQNVLAVRRESSFILCLNPIGIIIHHWIAQSFAGSVEPFLQSTI